ncbi:NADPH-dependent FMN reductase [Piscinibacter sp.]|uniref:NADPH-dependent FMN reductase n=1 Tax=Piscinibacter sp. TaxID=1903157 RepID=UPI002C740D40|nr:NADPH-dependent FMN reductase [Albitalea sp.]HUG21904.1 NADPH-dependent FMN reductase [Albitalea sp.]
MKPDPSQPAASTPRRVLALCGSLRARSYNRSALNAAAEQMPAGTTLQLGSLLGIPIYNADDQSQGWPPAVPALAEAVRACDAVLIASPEYNFSIPGGLKNALDWLSRLPDPPFKGKPVALMGAATGPLGTARMQYDLRRVLQFLEADVLQKPEIFIGHAATKFDDAGRLVDDTTRRFIGDQMRALIELVERNRRSHAPAA